MELEQRNTALKVLLEQRVKDREDFENRVSLNVSKLVLPYVEELLTALRDPAQLRLMTLIRENLTGIISPFAQSMKSSLEGLSARELRVANMVAKGLSNKEMSEMLKVSVKTVEYYRSRIRGKLGIKNKKVNLQNHLNSLI